MNKQTILCMIGKHKWIYTHPNVNLPSRRRNCSYCHKEDIIKTSELSLSETMNMISQGLNQPHDSSTAYSTTYADYSPLRPVPIEIHSFNQIQTPPQAMLRNPALMPQGWQNDTNGITLGPTGIPCPHCNGSGRKPEEPKEDIPTKPNINNPISGLELEE